MGVGIANLSTDQLSQIIQGTNLTMPEALALQKAIELEGLAAQAKTEQEAKIFNLEAQKLRADIAQIGKLKPTASIQEFEYLKALQSSGASADQILEFQQLIGTAPDQMSVKDQIALQEYYNEISNSPGLSGASQGVAATILGSAITQQFGGKHQGLDYVLSGGKTAGVQTPVTGTVIDFKNNGEYNGGWGNYVLIDVGGGETHRFAHLSSVDPGIIAGNKLVSVGQVVGLQGNTGNTHSLNGGDGTHVHYQIESNGTLVNPKTFLQGIKDTPVTTEYTDSQLATLRDLKGAKITGPIQDALKAEGLTVGDLSLFDPATAPFTIEEKQGVLDVLSTIETIKDHEGFNNAVGFSLQKSFVDTEGGEQFLSGTAAADFQTIFNSFRDSLVLPNLDKLKGAMSDNDIKFIRNATTALSLSQSEEGFLTELNKIQERYNQILNNKGQGSGTTTEPTAPTYTVPGYSSSGYKMPTD